MTQFVTNCPESKCAPRPVNNRVGKKIQKPKTNIQRSSNCGDWGISIPVRNGPGRSGMVPDGPEMGACEPGLSGPSGSCAAG
jgi:hypothetical protein